VGFDAGKLAPALGAAGAAVEARGVALTAGKVGDRISIALRGEISGVSGLPVRGGAVYLSDSDEGGYSGLAASGGGALAQMVGWSTDGSTVNSGTRVYLAFQDAGTLN
jgi:hypothetical protein